ncbi:MAG: RluA family pseudouridine synthase [Alphaproteobacteria bacterium]|nr:RluA family pseudouridine synthase [Alphaproteobacteria bacterium]OJV12103.1 MAG: hypothetical protein BGO27_05120 [Alphaproteobacteria bacterium 33-17]
MLINHTVPADYENTRLDRYLKKLYPHLIQSRIQKALRKGLIKVDQKRVEADHRVSSGAVISIDKFLTIDESPEKSKAVKAPKEVSDKKAKFLLDSILYQNEDIIIINKPIGIAVQGGSKVQMSLDDMLPALQFNATEAPKLVHRLDKDTSGVLVLARTHQAAVRLSAMFKKDQVDKTYLAVCVGKPKRNKGVIDMPIEVMGQKKDAKTLFNVLDHYGNDLSLIEFKPVTGRKHQIRIHASRALNTPILGDGKYGGESAFVDGLNIKLHLHARNIKLMDKTLIDITAPIFPHMKETFRILGFTL